MCSPRDRESNGVFVFTGGGLWRAVGGGLW